MTTQLREPLQFINACNETPELYVAYHPATHLESMEILADNGLMPVTYQDALSRSLGLMKQLGGLWFHLQNVDIQMPVKNGIYTFNNKGELIPYKVGEENRHIVPYNLRQGNRDVNIRVCFNAGCHHPPSLYVIPDNIVSQYSYRFTLTGFQPLNSKAPAIVGIKEAQNSILADVARR